MKIPKPPKGLQAPGKTFWRKVLAEYELGDAHDLERLFQAGRCLDEIAFAERVVELEGRFIVDRFHQKREHPAAKAARDHRVLFFRAVRELGLDLTTAPENRPPSRY